MFLPSSRPKLDAEINAQRFSHTGCPHHALWAVLVTDMTQKTVVTTACMTKQHSLMTNLVQMLLFTLPFGGTEVMKSSLASPRDRTSSCREWCEHRHTFSAATWVSTEQPVSRELPGGVEGQPTVPLGTRAALPLGTTLGTGMATEWSEMQYVLPEPWHTASTPSTSCNFPQRQLLRCSTESSLQLAEIFVSHRFCSLSTSFNNTPWSWQSVAGKNGSNQSKATSQPCVFILPWAINVFGFVGAGGLAMLLRDPSGPCSYESSEATKGAGVSLLSLCPCGRHRDLHCSQTIHLQWSASHLQLQRGCHAASSFAQQTLLV